MVSVFLSILTNALLPILAIVAFGFGLQRFRPMESRTLVTLNLYFFVPVYLFARILKSSLSLWDIAQVGFVVLVPLFILCGVGYQLLTRMKGLRTESLAAVLVAGSFSNCGNFGLPVAELAFGPRGGEVHAIIVLFANFSIFSIAYAMLAMGKGEGVSSILKYFRLPYFYCAIAALAIRDSGLRLPTWTITCVETIADGLVPIALVTLGAQLANRARLPNWKLVSVAIGMKLVVLPVITLAFVFAMGLWPWPGVVLVLAATAPAAINPLLLTMQLDGDVDTMSDCVFWTTLLSAFTVAVWLTLLKSLHAESFVSAL